MATIWTKEKNLNSRNIMTRMTDRYTYTRNILGIHRSYESMAMITQANMMPIPVDRIYHYVRVTKFGICCGHNIN